MRERIENMRISIKASFLVLLIPLFVSCASTPKIIFEALANTRFNESFSQNEISRKKDENVYPFTMNYKNHYGCPVISIQLDGKLFTFLVDTGCERTSLYNNGIIKLFGSVERLEDANLNGYVEYIQQRDPEKLKNKSITQIKETLHKDIVEFNTVFTINSAFANFMYWPKNDNIDGVIGQDFMKKHKTVTFDFVTNYLTFDGDKINGSVLPFVKTDMEVVFVEFSYNGKPEYGLIDTGNYTFSPRSNFGKDETTYDFKRSNGYSIAYKGRLKKRFPWILTFSGIKIGNIEYNNIKGVYSNIWFSTYNKGAQNMLLFVNGLGCELFRNHIIQFDYENKNLVIL
jgi:hypothetical protein